MKPTTALAATKNLTKGCRVRLFTGESATLICWRRNGDVVVQVDGQRGFWDMLPEQVTAA